MVCRLWRENGGCRMESGVAAFKIIHMGVVQFVGVEETPLSLAKCLISAGKL